MNGNPAFALRWFEKPSSYFWAAVRTPYIRGSSIKITSCRIIFRIHTTVTRTCRRANGGILSELIFHCNGNITIIIIIMTRIYIYVQNISLLRDRWTERREKWRASMRLFANNLVHNRLTLKVLCRKHWNTSVYGLRCE